MQEFLGIVVQMKFKEWELVVIADNSLMPYKAYMTMKGNFELVKTFVTMGEVVSWIGNFNTEGVLNIYGDPMEFDVKGISEMEG